MKTIKLCGLIALLAAMATLASATNIDCAGPGASTVTVPDVTLLSPNTCSVIGSSFIFSNFGVSATGGVAGATVGIADPSAGTGVVGNDTNLVFQITGAGSGSGDILLFYEITGASLSALDITLQGTGAGSVTVTEIACSQAFTAGSCLGTTYANFSAMSSDGVVASNSESLIGGPESTVYVKKDISFSGATLSEFENSQVTGAVPEPMTLSMLGVGLLGLGLFGRKLRK